jgi:hypothetical protein
MPLKERDRAENLILLCNNHHQLVDSQPQTYSVERLFEMKTAHEQWVEKTLSTGKDWKTNSVQPPRVTEVVHSTLLPVERMPAYVYGAPFDKEERTIQGQLGRPRDGEMVPYVVRGKMLWAFQDLAEHGNPFESMVAGQPVDRFRVEEWWNDPDRLVWFLQLLNRALRKLTRRRGLQFDQAHDRYYFPPKMPGVGYSVRYRPLNRKQASRQVVWRPRKKATGLERPYWYHRAAALGFMKTGQGTWALSIRPELRVTVDGLTPPPTGEVGGKVTRKKSRMFNYDLLAELQFWRDYLSESKPRIILPFGHPRQTIVIMTTLMRGEVTWPGIPRAHAMPFKNVEYLDDLFSWAEFSALEAGLEDDEEDERLEEDGAEGSGNASN